jgi:tetratricopeptide (TPR) repeat protein
VGPNYLRGIVLFEQRQYEGAEIAFRQAVVDEPEFAMAYAMLASTQNNLHKYKAARYWIDKALALDPDNSYSYYILGHVCWGEKLFEDAEKAAQQALQIYPEYVECYAFLGALCIAREQWWRAKEWSEKGLSIQPEHVGCLEVLIEALFGLRLYKPAEAVIQTLLRINPELAEAHRRKSWIDYRKGRSELAIEALRYVASQEPETGDRVQRFRKLARPSGRKWARPLESIPRLAFLAPLLQFVLIVSPTITYLVIALKWPDWKLGKYLSAAWASATLALAGWAAILYPMLYNFALKRPRNPKFVKPRTFLDRLREWMRLGGGVLTLIYIFLFVTLAPFFSPRGGSPILIYLSLFTTYRVIENYLVHVGYRRAPTSGLLLRYLRGLRTASMAAILTSSLMTAIIMGAIWGWNDHPKPEPVASPTAEMH